MITISTEFKVNNLELFDLLKRRLSRPEESPGGFLRILKDNSYCIFCPNAPLLIDNRYDPDEICASLQHILPPGSRMSLYIIDDDGEIDSFYISDTRLCRF